jgi:chemotaxis protein CheC
VCLEVTPVAVGDTFLDKERQRLFGSVVAAAMRRSTESLSKMTGAHVKLVSPRFGLIPIASAADLAGGADRPVAGVYLTVSGDASGHILLLFPENAAYRLVDVLCELPLGSSSELDEMGKSCLGEVGNITGTSFLIGLSEHTGLLLRPSPPEVVQDMVGAILSTILAELSMVSDEAFVIETEFTEETTSVVGMLLFVPTGDSLGRILSSVELAADGD